MNWDIITQNYLIVTIGTTCLLLILHSWLLPIIVISVCLGYYAFNHFHLYLTRFLNYLIEQEHEKEDGGGISSRSVVANLFYFIRSIFYKKDKTRPITASVNHVSSNHTTANSSSTKNMGIRNYDKIDKRKEEELFDPLLHTTSSPELQSLSPSSITTKKKTSSLRRPSTESENQKLPKSPLLQVNSSLYDTDAEFAIEQAPETIKSKLTLVNRTKTDLKIDEILDKHIAKLCKVIFAHYVVPEWAPYETRQQLRQTLRKVLIVFAERIKCTFFEVDPSNPSVVTDKTKLINFCKHKIIPLLFHHLECLKLSSSESFPTTTDISGDSNHNLSASQLKRLQWKVRRLSQRLLLEFMPPEQANCKLWTELCVSILGDGVLWNCILLGRDELPKIIEEALEHLLLTLATTENNSESSMSSQNVNENIVDSSSGSGEDQCDNISPERNICDGIKVPEHIRSIPNENTMKQIEPEEVESHKLVPMLLDSFLEPHHDLEQPSSIVSRWRPTLNEILNERDLLYTLIQYLRGERALEYLQAVLDESPDGSAYCRRIIELEYLPNFCRSKLFLESMGMSRVDFGEEAGTSESLVKPRGSTLKKTNNGKHVRSNSSGGGVSSGIFKSTGIVDGLAISPNSLSPNAGGLPSSGASSTSLSSEAESIRKRQHLLQPFIKKFFDSVTSFGRQDDPTALKEKVKRVGIDYRNYEDMYHPEVLKETSVEPCDILTCSVEIGASWITKASWLESVIIGWVQLFHPFLKPKFDSITDEMLDELLVLDNFIKFIDLITKTFVESMTTMPFLNDNSGLSATNIPSPKSPSSATISPLIQVFVKWMILNLFDYSQIITSIHRNRDEFILFFVDVLDVLVNELTRSAH